MNLPTERQLAVLHAIKSMTERRGFPPTIRELGDSIGIPNPSAVLGHLLALERKGLLTSIPGKARTLTITPQAKDLIR